jgi:cell division transport system permease protein
MSSGFSPVRRLRSWARRHSFSFFSSLGSLMRHRVGTLMTVLVLGIALLLPLVLYICMANLDRMELQEEEWGALTVFMQDGVDASRAESLAERLQAREDVSEVGRVSPEQGLAEFREASGFGPALETLGHNPLPWVLSVTPAPGEDVDLEARAAALLDYIATQPGVASVTYDRKWLQRLGRMLELGRAAVTLLTLLFSVAVVVVVANTIRLDVAARAEEIEILALVGAQNGFIRLPFLYSGFWYGLLGGVVAMVLVNGALLYLEGPLGRLLDSYGVVAQIIGLGGLQTLGLLLTGGLLGLLGALVAVQRYLRLLRVDGMLGRR